MNNLNAQKVSHLLFHQTNISKNEAYSTSLSESNSREPAEITNMFHGHRTDIFQPYQSPNKQKSPNLPFSTLGDGFIKTYYIYINFIRLHPFLRVRAYNMAINKVHKKTHCCLQTKTRLQNTNSYVTLLASLFIVFIFLCF